MFRGCSSTQQLVHTKRRIAFESKYGLYLIVMLFSDSPAPALNNQYLGGLGEGEKKRKKEKVNLSIGLQRGGSKELSQTAFRNK